MYMFRCACMAGLWPCAFGEGEAVRVHMVVVAVLSEYSYKRVRCQNCQNHKLMVIRHQG